MLLRFTAAALASCWATAALAGGLVFCDRSSEISAADQDRMLRFTAVVKEQLEGSGSNVALVSRAGTDLSRFGIRYSHAGIALRNSPNGAWSVRQLYFACDESRPRLFDQGMSGFVIGADAARLGYVSIVSLPGLQAAALETAALDKPLALTLQAGDYSANAYAWATRYQNCNQWVVEMLAAAWGSLRGVPATAARGAAQQWLREQQYEPEAVRIPGQALMFAGQFIPLIHLSDHPQDDVYALTLRVSLPDSIEAFARRQAPEAQRVEMCYDTRHMVVHRGWQPLGPGCEPLPGDEVIDF
jgi:hypothetical protein